MKALFVFLFNARPLNIPVYSLKKKCRRRGRMGRFCLFRGYLLSCLATIRLKTAKTQKSFPSLQLPSLCLLTQTSKKDSCGLLIHLTLLLNKIPGIAFPIHTDPFNLVHSENYRNSLLASNLDSSNNNPIPFA